MTLDLQLLLFVAVPASFCLLWLIGREDRASCLRCGRVFPSLGLFDKTCGSCDLHLRCGRREGGEQECR